MYGLGDFDRKSDCYSESKVRPEPETDQWSLPS